MMAHRGLARDVQGLIRDLALMGLWVQGQLGLRV